jgi:hypothetical protein
MNRIAVCPFRQSSNGAHPNRHGVDSAQREAFGFARGKRPAVDPEARRSTTQQEDGAMK